MTRMRLKTKKSTKTRGRRKEERVECDNELLGFGSPPPRSRGRPARVRGIDQVESFAGLRQEARGAARGRGSRPVGIGT